jgi:hypothetical protein
MTAHHWLDALLLSFAVAVLLAAVIAWLRSPRP